MGQPGVSAEIFLRSTLKVAEGSYGLLMDPEIPGKRKAWVKVGGSNPLPASKRGRKAALFIIFLWNLSEATTSIFPCFSNRRKVSTKKDRPFKSLTSAYAE